MSDEKWYPYSPDMAKVGDVVKLAGSPWHMTVVGVPAGGAAMCAWIDTSGHPHQTEYPIRALERRAR